MGRKVDESSKLKTGSVYPSKYYGDMEVLEDLNYKGVTVKFLDTGYIKSSAVRGNVIRGNVKDDSVKYRANDVNIKVGINTINSYLEYEGINDKGKHIYLCKLCGKPNQLVKKYRECNIPISCGCAQKLKPQGKDFTGMVIEGIQVLGYSSGGKWRVIFSCGHSYDVPTSTISGRASSKCKKCVSKQPTTLDHGHAKRSGYSSEYISWLGMKGRCDEDSHNRYEFYKGKGITYPDEWKDFNVFLSDMGYKPTPEHSIERLDVNKGYYKGNCIWADKKTQANNKTNNIRIRNILTKEVMSLKHWCDLEGVDYKKAHYRFRYKGECIKSILGDNYEVNP